MRMHDACRHIVVGPKLRYRLQLDNKQCPGRCVATPKPSHHASPFRNAKEGWRLRRGQGARRAGIQNPFLARRIETESEIHAPDTIGGLSLFHE